VVLDLIPSKDEVGRSVGGVLHLLRSDPAGFGLIDLTPTGFYRSFGAFVWCWPAQIFLWTGLWGRLPEARPATIGENLSFLLTATFLDMIAVLVPVLILLPVSRVFGFSAHFTRLVVATNWFALVAAYVAFIPASLRYLFAASTDALAIMSLAVSGLTIWLYFRVARMALAGDQMMAILVTLIMVMVGLLIVGLATGGG